MQGLFDGLGTVFSTGVNAVKDIFVAREQSAQAATNAQTATTAASALSAFDLEKTKFLTTAVIALFALYLFTRRA